MFEPVYSCLLDLQKELREEHNKDVLNWVILVVSDMLQEAAIRVVEEERNGQLH